LAILPLNGPCTLATLHYPIVRDLIKDSLANRSPKSPQKKILGTDDWNLKTAANEKPLLIDDALIRSNYGASIPQVTIHVRVHVGEIGGETDGHIFVNVPTD
jgi:hypothetical protein